MRWAKLLVAAVLLSCGPAAGPRSPERESTRASSPSELLPASLDFVIRIDAARLREHPLMMGLAKGGDVHLHDTLVTGDGSGIVRLVLPEIERARSIVLGGRLATDGYAGDGVIAVEQASGDAPRRAFAADASLSRLRSTRRSIELYERASAARDQAALYVVMEDKGLVLATPAEMDAVLRVLRDGPDTGRLDPPPRGLFSFAGRFRPGNKPPLPASAVSLREIGVGLQRYEGSIEADDLLRIEAQLTYQSEAQATAAAEVARKVLDQVALIGPDYSSLSDSAKLAPVGPVLGLRLSVPFALLTRMH